MKEELRLNNTFGVAVIGDLERTKDRYRWLEIHWFDLEISSPTFS